MKAADNRDAILAEVPGKIVGIEDDFAGALDGAKQRDFRAVKDIRIADRPHFRVPFELMFHGLDPMLKDTGEAITLSDLYKGEQQGMKRPLKRV